MNLSGENVNAFMRLILELLSWRFESRDEFEKEIVRLTNSQNVTFYRYYIYVHLSHLTCKFKDKTSAVDDSKTWLD